jgi:enoyl-CoA hydratase/carnithine racemase
MTATTAERRLHPHLVETRSGGVATLRVDRPQALGALSRDILGHLRDYLDRLRADPDIRALILTGTGRGFIAGADIGEYDGASQAAFVDYQRLGRATFDSLAALPQVTIAAVNGYALGGGFEVTLCCDLVIAAEGAKFGLPEVKLGLLPGGGGTQRLARAAGAAFAKELVLTGRFATAAELAGRGLIARVCPAQRLTAEAAELADAVAANAPLAVRAGKRLINDGLRMPLDLALDTEQDVLARLYAGPDGKEGVAAFIAKREPLFRGDRPE